MPLKRLLSSVYLNCTRLASIPWPHCATIRTETGKIFSKSYLHMLLKNLFYSGFFDWDGARYKGTHPLIVSPELVRRGQDVLDSHNRPKYRKHEFAFGRPAHLRIRQLRGYC